MITIQGKYNSANVMIDNLDEETISQIYSFLNHPAFANTYIAIMPDAHKGAGAVIGFTAKRNDYVIPNVVGVDIGCGVLAINLGYPSIDFAKLDQFIRENVPSGFSVRGKFDKMVTGRRPSELVTREVIELSGKTEQDQSRVIGSIGTLGGGNHFIEIDHDESTGMDWLLIHSGSRNFGLKIANYYQNKAKALLKTMFIGADAYKDAEYLPMGSGGGEYLEAMMVAQSYAKLNRAVMAEVIMKHIYGNSPSVDFKTIMMKGQSYIPVIDTVHNYISFEDNIIRKGAVSAQEGELLVIPFNMRDGVMMCRGKGNSKWNYSAPHGAGRIISRNKAKRELSMVDFTASMQGIYTTTATQNTIDESPMAYKDKDMIIAAVAETVDIDRFLKPVYNFKAGEE
jgi:tRNA-splicing ligase RtcB